MSHRKPHYVLRSMLRLVKTPELPAELLQKHSATQAQYSNNVRTMVLQEYRQGGSAKQQQDVTDTTATHADSNDSSSRLLYRYYELLQNLHERQRLFDLDQGAEERFSPMELSRRAAARAGLQLPESYSS